MEELNDRFKEIYKLVEKFCFDRENPEKAIQNMRNFSEGYDAFGIDDEEIKILRDRILDEYDLSPRDLADFGLILLKSGKYEFGTLAIFLIKKHRPRLDPYIRERVKEWLDTAVENWAHADLLGIKILPVLFELELTDLQSFSSWRDSPSKWTRRAAITSLIWLRKAFPAEDVLRFIEPVLNDKEHVVQQAICWLLKDLWNKAGEPVEEFLETHKNDMNRTTLKQVTATMPLSKARKFLPQKAFGAKTQNGERNKRFHKNRNYSPRNSNPRERGPKPIENREK
ncbi:MAG: DNA alkylation repair protein [Candidatus Cloacimonetes bacterium]|jgi:3-methyladenine DNA glycosylase AlkD|nr:DNA alkylation repair protein [Candidatus Cloacimonadota bacterium]MDD2505975.1 DNA alkylation repair protein [Candidatus Cloacimonadota bacterium]MDD4146969.1 DNA alkylation repair protein [Candidatus Cloacimonadota bacterium]MDD4559269.1 DNA alkylation repair protein [Candidatus Cloacimonadota bacterium]